MIQLMPTHIEKRYFVKILFHEKHRQLAKVIYYKKDMTFDFYLRWEWYFLYRAAKIRVQNPKAYIAFEADTYDYILPAEALRKKVYDRLIGAKRTLTKVRNQMANARANWGQLFGIEEHPHYQKALKKIEHHEKKLAFWQGEWDKINTNELT